MIYNIQTKPELEQLDLGTYNLIYSKHATNRCIKKDILKLKDITIKGNVVEVETNHVGALTKVVVRIPQDNGTDSVMSLVPCDTNRTLIVTTAWLNATTDNHSTLDKGRLT